MINDSCSYNQHRFKPQVNSLIGTSSQSQIIKQRTKQITFMASAATLLSPLPNYAHAGIDSAMSTSSPSGLDNLSFDDLVEWNAGNSSSGYFNQQSSSPPSPRATSTSTSTSTYAQPSNNNHPASTSPSIESSDNPPSNANTEALFVSLHLLFNSLN